MTLKTFVFAALLAVVATPAVAQAPAPAALPETSAPAAPLSGPRVPSQSQFRPVEARLIGSPEPMFKKKSSETITVSTLVLVLLVVILVLLIT